MSTVVREFPVLTFLRRRLDRYGARPGLVRWGFVGLWCGLVYYASSVPATGPASSGGVQLVHNSAHVLVFGVLAALVLLAQQPAGETREEIDAARIARRWWLAVGFAVIYGIADELHQLAVPGRKASWWDGVSDAVGAVWLSSMVVWIRYGAGWAARLAVLAAPVAIGSVVLASQ